jgi:hypothetical protein
MYPNLYPFSISRYMDITFTMCYPIIRKNKGERGSKPVRRIIPRMAANVDRIHLSRQETGSKGGEQLCYGV